MIMRIFISSLLTLLIACATQEQWTTSPSGLKYIMLKKGKGTPAQAGNEVLIHETMKYPNDSLIFDSRTLPGPVKVKLGANQAIAGVDEGLHGMRQGEIRKLIVPPALSRRKGNSQFPHPDSTLIYEIELMQIIK